MTDISFIEAHAEYYANIPIIDRTYKSSVHLEDMIDERFWDVMLQECRPGKYYYIYYSKNESGKDTTGCEQCLKYKNYLSDRFFICIDSDLRYLEQETEVINNPLYYRHIPIHGKIIIFMQKSWSRDGGKFVRNRRELLVSHFLSTDFHQ